MYPILSPDVISMNYLNCFPEGEPQGSPFLVSKKCPPLTQWSIYYNLIKRPLLHNLISFERTVSFAWIFMLIMLRFLDIFFVIFHSAFILFNLFGWICQRTRKLNLITLALTGLSWFVLGIFYGIGYCPLTDWHWQVLDKLGAQSWSHSYIQYLIDRLFGIYIPAEVVDTVTLIAYFAALLISVYVNVLKRRRIPKK